MRCVVWRLSPRWGEGRVRGEIVKIPKQNPEGVANTAIRVPETRKDFFRERHVCRVINAAGPKSQKIRTVLADEVFGSSWFFVCARFGDFFTIQIHDETVSDTRFVRRTITQGDARHQR